MTNRAGNIGDFALVKKTNEIHKILWVVSYSKFKVQIPESLSTHFKDLINEEEDDENHKSIFHEFDGFKIYSYSDDLSDFRYKLDDNNLYNQNDLIIGVENIRELKLDVFLNGI
jgi:hypothetical protein